MRILFVSHHFPPAHTAGTETYAYNLARRLKARHQVMVFHTEKRLGCKPYQVLTESCDGVDTRVLINNLCYRDFGETFSDPKAEQAFLEVFRSFRPDVVHVHHLMFSSLEIPVMAAAEGVPVVMTLHDFYLFCPRGGRLFLPDGSLCPGPEEGRCADCLSSYKYRQGSGERRIISALARIRSVTGLDLTKWAYFIRDRFLKKDVAEGIVEPGRGDPANRILPFLVRREEAVKRLFSAVMVFLTPSNTVGDGVKSFGLPPDKLRLWRYGIDLEPFKDLARPERSVPVFGYLGTLMPHKGVHVLVEAAGRVPEGRIRLMVRGSDAHNPEYARRLRSAAGPDTTFLPAFDRSEVGEAFTGIDVLVLPSLWLENSPVAIQEAFAAGCPVVTSDLGGMRELVEDGVNGRLFPPGDVEALAAVLREAGENPGLIQDWRRSIEPPRSIEDDVESLEALYGRLQKS